MALQFVNYGYSYEATKEDLSLVQLLLLAVLFQLKKTLAEFQDQDLA